MPVDVDALFAEAERAHSRSGQQCGACVVLQALGPDVGGKVQARLAERSPNGKGWRHTEKQVYAVITELHGEPKWRPAVIGRHRNEAHDPFS